MLSKKTVLAAMVVAGLAWGNGYAMEEYSLKKLLAGYQGELVDLNTIDDLDLDDEKVLESIVGTVENESKLIQQALTSRGHRYGGLLQEISRLKELLKSTSDKDKKEIERLMNKIGNLDEVDKIIEEMKKDPKWANKEITLYDALVELGLERDSLFGRNGKLKDAFKKVANLYNALRNHTLEADKQFVGGSFGQKS